MQRHLLGSFWVFGGLRRWEQLGVVFASLVWLFFRILGVYNAGGQH